jgi:hypothetical protein
MNTQAYTRKHILASIKSMMVTAKNILCVFSGFIFIAISAFSQQADVRLNWADHYEVSDSLHGAGFSVDAHGCVFVCGVTQNVNSGVNEIVTIKYSKEGERKWVRTYANPGADLDNARPKIKATGNCGLYVGFTYYPYSGAGNSDITLLKYDSVGTQQWAAPYNGSGNAEDVFTGLSPDALGNVYVSGVSYTNSGNYDFLVLKYNSNGIKQWEYQHDGSGQVDYSLSVAAYSGFVYAMGGTYNSVGNADFFTVKLNSSGVEQWSATYNGPDDLDDFASALAVDNSGNAIITGSSINAAGNYDFVTVKYNSNGIEQWANIYDGGTGDDELATGIVCDSNGNIFLTGNKGPFNQTAFPPNFMLLFQQNPKLDFADAIITLKYNSSGNEEWVQQEYEPLSQTVFASNSTVSGIALDNAGNPYIAGYRLNYTSNSQQTSFSVGTLFIAVKYNTQGSVLWKRGFSGTALQNQNITFRLGSAFGISVPKEDEVYITGGAAAGQGNSFAFTTIKIAPCSLTADAGPDQTINPGESVQIGSVPSALPGVYYNWEPNDGSLNDPSVANPIASPQQTTEYILTVTRFGCSAMDTVVVSVGSACNLTADAGPDQTIFAGQSVQIGSAPVAGVTYSWSPVTGLSDPNIANPVASPTKSTTYVLTINQLSCTETSSITISITTNDCYSGLDTTISESQIPFLSKDVLPLSIIPLDGNPTILHVVWYKKSKDINIKKYILEKSIDLEPFYPIACANPDSLIDIMSLGNIKLYSDGKINYSSEGSDLGYYYNDYIINPTSLSNVSFRLKVVSDKYIYYSIPELLSFGPSPAIGLSCSPFKIPIPPCADAKLPKFTYANCCQYTSYKVYECTCNSFLTFPCTINQTDIICSVDSCDCSYDPCCVHFCNERKDCVCNNNQWNSCPGGSGLGNYLYDVLTDITPFEPIVTIKSGSIPVNCGQSITLDATLVSFVSGSFTYSWSTGATTSQITVSPPTTTTYTVTVTMLLPNGDICPGVASITIPVNVPKSVIKGNDLFCVGQSTTLTASQGAGYLWSTGATSQSITVSPTVSTTYTVTVYYQGSNCYSTASTTVSVNPAPPEPIIAANEPLLTCDLDGINYFVSNPPAGALYQWSASPNATLACSSCPNTLISFANGTLSGTVSVTVTDANGCSSSSSININPCCGNPNAGDIVIANTTATDFIGKNPNYFSGTGSSNDPYIINGQDIYINGVFVINTHLKVMFRTVKMGENAKIVVPGVPNSSKGNSLTIFCSHFLAGCGKMWDGIFVYDNSFIKAEGQEFDKNICLTIIEDADSSIVSVNGASFTILSVNFINNYKDVVIMPYSSPHTGTMWNNVFKTSTSGLLPPRQGQKTETGVEIRNVAGITIGVSGQNPNIFDNMGIGIRSINSSVSVLNNQFKNIITASCPPPAKPSCQILAGVAVWHTGTIQGVIPNLVVGQSKQTGNKFKDCTTGVLCDNNSTILINNNDFKNVSSSAVIGSAAVKVQLLTAGAVDVNTNNFNDFNRGVWLRLVDGTVNIGPGNQFNSQLAKPQPVGDIGIILQSSLPNPVNNTSVKVFDNDMKNVQTGIWLTNYKPASPVLITGNKIEFKGKTSGALQQGIVIENSFTWVQNQNEVKYSGKTINNATDADQLRGINLSNSPNCFVGDNQFLDMGTGIRCFGNSNPSGLRCNVMKRCYNGVALIGSSLGPQGFVFSGNTFPQDNQWFNTAQFDILGQSNTQETWMYRTGGPYMHFDPAPWLPFSAISDFPLSNFSSNFNCSVGCLTPPCKKAQLKQLVQNMQAGGILPEENSVLKKEHVYRTLRKDPYLLQPDTISGFILQQFFDSMAASPMGSLVQVEELINAGDTLAARQLNNNLSPSNVMEANYREVYNIYIDTWATGTLNVSDAHKARLEAIAYQNQLLAGKAVYIARVMLSLFLDDSLPESTARLAEGMKEDMQEAILVQNYTSFSGLIYPNPNDGNMLLDYMLEEGKTGAVVIYDITGKKAAAYKLSPGSNTLVITEPMLGKGIYLYEIWIDNEIVNRNKITIIK